MNSVRIALAVGCLCLLHPKAGAAEPIELTGWAPLDIPERRAMWVWNMARTRQGLPEAGIKATKQQTAAYKAANRTWGGATHRQRMAENYKGVRDLLLDFCESKSIREIYVFHSAWEWAKDDLREGKLSNEALWVALNKEANERGLRVWLCYYLWDAPDDARMTTRLDGMIDYAKVVLAFNKAHPGSEFAGIHCDQEPRKAESYLALLKSMKNAQDWIDANDAGILNSQALRPAWLRDQVEWNGATMLMADAIIQTISHSALMCYSDNIRSVNKWSDAVVALAAKRNRRAAIGFEVNCLTGLWPSSERETWWEDIRAEADETRFQVDLEAAPVTFEDAMAMTAKRHAENVGFDRMVIHAYSGYFEHWFGMAPRDYIESLPGGKYESSSVRPARANLRKDTRPLYESMSTQ